VVTEENVDVNREVSEECGVSIALQRYLEERMVKDLTPEDALSLVKDASDPSRSDFLKQLFINILYDDKRLLERELGISDLDRAFSNQSFIERVAEVAVERARLWPNAPLLRISYKTLRRNDAAKLLKGLNFGLIYGAETILFQDTVLAYQVDEACSRLNGHKVNVIGVHYNWLTDDGKASRGIIVDNSWRVKEVEFEEPVDLNVIQILHLPSEDERETHKRLSTFFSSRGIPQINPFDSSCRADDKFTTHELWSNLKDNLNSPAYALIKKGKSIKEALRVLARFSREISDSREKKTVEVYVQPNTGTEGRMVNMFTLNLSKEPNEWTDVTEHLSRILRVDDALVRERRGNVLFKRPSDPRGLFRYISIRINAAWDGSKFVAESGYAQTSRDASIPVASRSRGGDIISLNDAFKNLYYKVHGKYSKLRIQPSFLSKIKKAVEVAAGGLNIGLNKEDYLKMVGIDILLEVDGGDVKPVLLEANPRPAGLASSVSLEKALSMRPKLMISYALFNYIRSIQ